MSIVIDLRTRTLPDEPNVFLVRPGGSYHLFDVVRETSAIAVDIPELQAADGEPIPLAHKIAPMLERGRLLRSWASKSAKTRGPRPSLKIEAYATFLEDQGPKMARTKLRNAANTVLWTIPDNSLLYVPASNLGGKAILAEAGPRTAPRVTVEGTGPRKGLKYLARAILSPKLVPMRDLPADVTDPGQKLLVHNKFEGYAKERLLRAYYGDYSRGSDVNVVEFIAGADQFDTKVIAQVSALAMSIEHFLDTGEYLKPEAFIFGYPEKRGPQLHARINSKDGKAQVETENIVPHAVKALLILAASSFATNVLAGQLNANDLVISNSSMQSGVDIVEATADALVNYAAAAGTDTMASIIDNLRASIEQSDGEVDGGVEAP